MGISSRLGLKNPIDVRRPLREMKRQAKWFLRAPMALLGRRPGRLSVHIQTTSRCDGRCVICPYQTSWHGLNPGEIGDDLYESLIRQLAGLPLETFCPYLQNEPLLDAKFLPRLKTAVERLSFRRVLISTNASPLTPDLADALAEIIEPVNHALWISFHGVEEGGYRAVMGLDYRRVLANIVYLLKLSQTRRLNVLIRGAGTPVPGQRRAAPHHFTPRQWDDFWNAVFERYGIVRRPATAYFSYNDRAGSVAHGSYRFRRRGRSLLGLYCRRADEWLHVLYNGDVILCCEDYHRRTVIANAARTPLAEILDGDAFRRCRRMVMGLRPAPADFICRRCTTPQG